MNKQIHAGYLPAQLPRLIIGSEKRQCRPQFFLPLQAEGKNDIAIDTLRCKNGTCSG